MHFGFLLEKNNGNRKVTWFLNKLLFTIQLEAKKKHHITGSLFNFKKIVTVMGSILIIIKVNLTIIYSVKACHISQI